MNRNEKFRIIMIATFGSDLYQEKKTFGSDGEWFIFLREVYPHSFSIVF